MSPPQLQALHIFGAGGHAKVIVDTWQQAGGSIAGIYDDRRDLWGQRLLGILVRGGLDSLPLNSDCAVVIAIGNNRIREKVVGRMEQRARVEGGEVRFPTVIHPQAIVSPFATIGSGTVIFASAVIQPDTVIAGHCIVNTSASVDHDGRLASYSQVCPGARIAGNVTLGRGAFVGTGASIAPGVTIGEGGIVGLGAGLLQDVPAFHCAYGVPAVISLP